MSWGLSTRYGVGAGTRLVNVRCLGRVAFESSSSVNDPDRREDEVLPLFGRESRTIRIEPFVGLYALPSKSTCAGESGRSFPLQAGRLGAVSSARRQRRWCRTGREQGVAIAMVRLDIELARVGPADIDSVNVESVVALIGEREGEWCGRGVTAWSPKS